jgi:hypothetical protein
MPGPIATVAGEVPRTDQSCFSGHSVDSYGPGHSTRHVRRSRADPPIATNGEALLRLGGSLLSEQHDEWLTAERGDPHKGSLGRLSGAVRLSTRAPLTFRAQIL